MKSVAKMRRTTHFSFTSPVTLSAWSTATSPSARSTTLRKLKLPRSYSMRIWGTDAPFVGALVDLVARALGALVVADDGDERARRDGGGREGVHVRVPTSVAVVSHVVRVWNGNACQHHNTVCKKHTRCWIRISRVRKTYDHPCAKWHRYGQPRSLRPNCPGYCRVCCPCHLSESATCHNEIGSTNSAKSVVCSP